MAKQTKKLYLGKRSFFGNVCNSQIFLRGWKCLHLSNNSPCIDLSLFYFRYVHVPKPEVGDDEENKSSEGDSIATVSSTEDAEDTNMNIDDYASDDNEKEGDVSSVEGSIIDVTSGSGSDGESEEESEEEYEYSDDPVEYIDGTIEGGKYKIS